MKPIIAVLDNIRSLYNVGSIFRTADAVGVDKLYLCGITPTPEHGRFRHFQEKDSFDIEPDKYGRKPAIEKTALSGLDTVLWEHQEDTLATLQKLKRNGYLLIALEITPTSTSLFDFLPEKDRPMALVVGHEREGVSREILDMCDEIVHIPMHGAGQSLNVSVSFGIAAYTLTHAKTAI